MEDFQRTVGWCETAGRRREGRFGAAGITRGSADKPVNKGGTAEEQLSSLALPAGEESFFIPASNEQGTMLA